MNNVLVRCSRCNRDIEGIKSEGVTGGFYESIGWEKYFDAGETIVCDDCMHCDHRYQKDYGNSIMKNHTPYGFLAQWNNFRLHYPE